MWATCIYSLAICTSAPTGTGGAGAEAEPSLTPAQDPEGLRPIFWVVSKLTTASESLLNSTWLGVRTAFR